MVPASFFASRLKPAPRRKIGCGPRATTGIQVHCLTIPRGDAGRRAYKSWMRLEAKRRDGVRSKVWSARAATWTELSKANPSSLHSGQREFLIAADRAPDTDMAVTRSRAVERAHAPRVP